MTDPKLGLIEERIRESIAIKEAIGADSNLMRRIASLAEECLVALRNGGKIIFAGNGGSFADAQHLSAEFVSRFMFERAPLASIVLAANCSAISAIGNDYGYEQVFARELSGLAKPEDVFIPISTSGNSPNILAAVNQAKQQRLVTVAFTGAGGGKLAGLCDCLCMPSNDTARVQECHIFIGHILCEIIERRYFCDAK